MARDPITPGDPELDAEPREVNPTLTLPDGSTVDAGHATDSGYAFWLRDGITPYRSRNYGYDVFSQIDDGWMGQQMVDPDSLWESTANEVADLIGGAGRLDEPNHGFMPFFPDTDDDLEQG
jgi:hypothetical protein